MNHYYICLFVEHKLFLIMCFLVWV